MAGRALRVLAVAFRPLGSATRDEPAEENLVFAGLLGMIDPPREEVVAAVRECRDAGVKPVMITGDHPDTALAIAREIGIAAQGDRIVTGAELDELLDDLLAADVPSIAVYARVSAKHKLQVIKAWQAREQVVAMTGDGVNDAPAVKAADIGVAMGVTGTDVTKETADMVLTDDNFASIIAAVKEGRGIYDNIQKFVHYLLSCNASEVLLMLLAGIASWPPPLGAIQSLWINLVTDGLPALALGMEPSERDIMRRAPRPRNEPVITWEHGLQILGHGLLMAITAAGAFWWTYRGDADRLRLAQTVAFAVMAYMQLLFSGACRSKRYTTPELGLFSNSYLWGAIIISAALQTLVLAWPTARRVFELDASVVSAAPAIIVAALSPVTLVESLKLLKNLMRTPNGNTNETARRVKDPST
jgi:Ca2+-transporting ATPase